MDIIRKLKNFCRKNKISDCNLDKLYRVFLDSSNTPISRETFDFAAFHLNKQPALRAWEDCRAYYSKYRDSYNKFIKEMYFVSKKFWDCAVKDKALMMEEVEEKTVIPEKPKKPPSLTSNDRYDELLPVDWSKINLSERIEFLKKVRHPGFFNYLLEIDPKLRNYYDTSISHAPQKEMLKLYITVFSFQSNTYSDESKALLKSFVDTLNQIGRARLQYVECKDPDVIEIREMRA